MLDKAEAFLRGGYKQFFKDTWIELKSLFNVNTATMIIYSLMVFCVGWLWGGL